MHNAVYCSFEFAINFGKYKKKIPDSTILATKSQSLTILTQTVKVERETENIFSTQRHKNIKICLYRLSYKQKSTRAETIFIKK